MKNHTKKSRATVPLSPIVDMVNYISICMRPIFSQTIFRIKHVQQQNLIFSSFSLFIKMYI